MARIVPYEGKEEDRRLSFYRLNDYNTRFVRGGKEKNGREYKFVRDRTVGRGREKERERKEEDLVVIDGDAGWIA